MPEETLYCPSCNQRVRVPEEMLGQPVQCPLCRLVFTAPTRGATAPPPVGSPAGAGWGAAQPMPQWGPPPSPGTPASLKGPAIGLIITGLLGLFFNLVGLGFFIYLQSAGIENFLERVPPEFQELIRQSFPAEGIPLQLAMRAVFLVVCAIIVLAGVQMLRLRGYWLAVIGSVLAIVNFMELCCCLGAPFGIWSLVVLFQPAIRAEFEQREGPR